MCHFVCLAHFTLSKQCVWGGWVAAAGGGYGCWRRSELTVRELLISTSQFGFFIPK